MTRDNESAEISSCLWFYELPIDCRGLMSRNLKRAHSLDRDFHSIDERGRTSSVSDTTKTPLLGPESSGTNSHVI